MNLPLPYALIFASLLSCFKTHEKAICNTRLHARRFTSHPLLDLSCIERLEELGAIETKVTTPIGEDKQQDFQVFILGKESKNPTKYAQRTLVSIQTKIQANPEHLYRFEDLLLSLLAGECIEYAHFYAKRNGFEINDSVTGYKQIKTLLAYCSLGQVNMLLWRAAHNIPKKDGTNSIDLSDLVNKSQSYYISYCQRGLEIHHYDRLKSSKPSKLSCFLIYEILKIRQPNHTFCGIEEYISAH